MEIVSGGPRVAAGLCLATLLSSLAGCATITNLEAVDQALISRATQRAVEALALPGGLRGRRVALQVRGFTPLQSWGASQAQVVETESREVTEGFLKAKIVGMGAEVLSNSDPEVLISAVAEIQGIHATRTRLFGLPVGSERTGRVKLTLHVYDLKTHGVSGPHTGTGAMTLEQ